MTKLLIDLLWLTALLDWVPMLACYLLGPGSGIAGWSWWMHRREGRRNTTPPWKSAEVIAVLLLVAGSASAADVRLAGDRSPLSTITNYTVHVGPASSTNATLFLQTGTNTTQTVSLPAGQWRAWVTATSSSGITSDPSNVLALDVPAPPFIRLQLQGAGDVRGPWRNLASFGVEPAAEQMLYRLEIAKGTK